MSSTFVIGRHGWLGQSLVETLGFQSSDYSLGINDSGSASESDIQNASILVICETLSPLRAMREEHKQIYLDNLRNVLRKSIAHTVIFFSSAITTRPADGLSPERAAYRLHKLECENLLKEYAESKASDKFFVLRPTAILGVGCHSNFLCESKRRSLAGDQVTFSNPRKRINGFVSKHSLIEFVARLTVASNITKGLHDVTLAANDSISVAEIAKLMVDHGLKNITFSGTDSFSSDDLYDTSAAISIGFAAGSCRNLIQSFLRGE